MSKFSSVLSHSGFLAVCKSKYLPFSWLFKKTKKSSNNSFYSVHQAPARGWSCWGRGIGCSWNRKWSR